MYIKHISPQELKLIDKITDLALEEDLGNGDVSAYALGLSDETSQAEIIAKQSGVLSGVSIASLLAQKVDPEITFEALKKDGDLLEKGDCIIRLQGNTSSLLGVERTMLNFLQRMSGIATTTAQYLEAVEDTQTFIVDTRKTAPGMRILDKMAVRAADTLNHRMDLSTMVMFKDNHLKVIRERGDNLIDAVELTRYILPISMRIEVETTTLEEVKEALEAGVDIIMLDNMSIEMMKEAMTIIDGQCEVEASGNMTLERIPEVAALGVDYISVGALTHSVKAFDMSMKFL